MLVKVLRLDFGLVGAVLGAFMGYLGFAWAYHQGFYALILPGALMGLGCGLMATGPSVVRGVICGVLGVAAGLLSEWKVRPFNVDGSLGFFLANLRELTQVTLLMVALGGGFAFWWGKDAFGPLAGRVRPPSRERIEL
jgi:hypothetical protein